MQIAALVLGSIAIPSWFAFAVAVYRACNRDH